MNVYQRLNEARTRFHAMELKKSGWNSYSEYHYFELGDFLIPALKVFAEVGLCANVSFNAETAHMTIRNVDEPTDLIVIGSPMGSAKLKGCHEVQNVGAVETYQRRYLWMAALEIVEHDAIDSSPRVEEPKKAAHRPVPGPKRGAHADALAAAGEMPQDWKDYLGELAERVCTIFDANENEGPKAGYELIAKENLDDIQKIYLSSILPSGVRNPIKDYSHAVNGKKAKEHA